MLQAKGLTKRFAGLVSVDHVDFSLARNEILGLIGPNGAGKTTLVNMISGTLRPSEGELAFKGERIDTLPSYRRAHLGIARTFQVMKPFPGLSTLDNVAVGAMFGTGGGEKSRAKAREKAREWLEFTGLGNRLEASADSLGGPDRKRLEFAKALAMEPELLLLDEVMAGLTAVEVDQVVELIKKIRDQGVTILVIEHVIKAIRSLSDRVLVLHHGEAIAEGDPATVLENPQVVEAYLGKRRA
ncbi:ABC transporter ATP-binding protein [Pararhizobium mangrovi]|uniref:ABC transporter ATP-binding protein n=1 Tax=Pararhizobium mangrovi TaxID=2590452 RepID=A0A506U8K2_9HYPH|nr:ABC transporter ATP-binding protein [Pararhizobium mangrovi]